MKYLGLLVLVFLLALLQTTRAQTASSRPVTDFYSPIVTEKINEGKHTAPANGQQNLPSEKPVPQKVRDMKGNSAAAHSNSTDQSKLPSTATADIENVKNRNRKFLRK